MFIAREENLVKLSKNSVAFGSLVSFVNFFTMSRHFLTFFVELSVKRPILKFFLLNLEAQPFKLEQKWRFQNQSGRVSISKSMSEYIWLKMTRITLSPPPVRP